MLMRPKCQHSEVDRICLRMKRNYSFCWRFWLSAIFDLHWHYKQHCSAIEIHCNAASEIQSNAGSRNTLQVLHWRHKSANPFIWWAKLWDDPCGRSIYSSKFSRCSHFVSKLVKSWHIWFVLQKDWHAHTVCGNRITFLGKVLGKISVYLSHGGKSSKKH